MMSKIAIAVLLVAAVSATKYHSEYVQKHTVKNSFTLPLPHTYTAVDELPSSFDWGNVNGTSFLTKSLNQHLPQYCGSCWAHGAMSSLADRIKIARGAKGVDFNLAIQYILNCGTETAGSCHGGDHLGAFQFIKESGYVPYDTCLQYEACSAESDEGTCGSGNYECKDINICRTCSTFTSNGGKCVGISTFPNASIAEYGAVEGSVSGLKAELFQRGPIACGVNAEPILEYEGGVYNNKHEDKGVNHIVSITGWGVDTDGTEYWNVRNSWGEYWGEVGYFRIATGDNQLGIEDSCAWATPAAWTELNFPCYEDGGNCQTKNTISTGHYTDPAIKLGLNRPHRDSLQPSA